MTEEQTIHAVIAVRERLLKFVNSLETVGVEPAVIASALSSTLVTYAVDCDVTDEVFEQGLANMRSSRRETLELRAMASKATTTEIGSA